MTRTSMREYAAAIRPRYPAATKPEKSVILDEFCQTTGYHRKAALRLLRPAAPAPPDRRGRRRQYGLAVAQALRTMKGYRPPPAIVDQPEADTVDNMLAEATITSSVTLFCEAPRSLTETTSMSPRDRAV